MARLVIEGDIKQLEVIAQTQRARASKYGLKISINEDKSEGKSPLIKTSEDEEPKKRGRKSKHQE